MTVNCEIRLNDSNQSFLPGNVVAGVIAYTLHEEDMLANIIISLRGSGQLTTYYTQRKRVTKEDYINVNQSLFYNSRGLTQAPGLYETPFNFILPFNLPPSLKCVNIETKYFKVQQCKIRYYLCVQFGRLDHKPDTIFKKTITIKSNVVPRIPIAETTIYEKVKYPVSFSLNPDSPFIEIKASVDKSVPSPGSTVKVNYRVYNSSYITVKDVVTKLIEVYTFKPEPGHQGKKSEDIVIINSPRGRIRSGYLRDETVEIVIPENTCTVEPFTHIVTREYIIKIIVKLPLLYSDVVIDIPVQICEHMTDTIVETCQNSDSQDTSVTESDADPIPSYSLALQSNRNNTVTHEEPPPTYLEAIGEEAQDDEAFGEMEVCNAWYLRT